MFKTYRTTNETIMGEETARVDTKLNLIKDVNGKQYVMVKNEKEHAIYDLSLIGHITEIVDDISYAEFREITYARLDKEWLEQGCKPWRRSS